MAPTISALTGLDGIGSERTEDRAAAGKNAECRADDGTAKDRRHHSFEVLASGPEPGDFCDHHRALFFIFQVADDLAQTKHPHRDGHKADAVSEFINSKSKALRTRIHIGPDES